MAGPRPPRVLVVSDDSETASIVREVLSERGYAVGSVTNEQVSLDSLSVGRPDLVVLDMFAPLLDKWPILDELLRLREAPPLVALTGRSVSPGALAALAFQTRGHLSKPFTPAALLRICEKVIAAPPPPAPPAGAERRRETRCRFVGEATLLTENGRPSLTLQVLDVSRAAPRSRSARCFRRD
jgi:CheY-like chemotaxis protein